MVMTLSDGTRESSDQILKTKKEFEDIEGTEESSKVIPNILKIKVFKRRWLVLGLFVLYSAPTNVHYVQYTIITNIIRRYYNVSALAVECTVIIYMVMYIVLVIPVSYLMDRFGLRSTVLIGAAGSCIGSWIKFLSTSPDRFAVALIGQSIIAVSQVIIHTVPGRLAAHWFGPKQVATATAIAIAGDQIGISTCYGITTILVKNHEKIEDIGADLSAYLFPLAIVTTVVVVAIFFFFQDEPPLPPSDNRALQKANRKTDTEAFFPAIKRLLGNRSFLLLWNSHGLMFSILGAFGTVLNSFYLAHFENGEEDVGRLGLCGVVMGAVGSGTFAFILDRTKKFRVITISLGFLCLFGEILFAVSFFMEIKWMVYASFMLFGAFLVGHSTVGIESCVEMTYPESEGTSTGILMISNQIYGTLLVLISGRMIEAYGDMAGHACFGVAIILSTLITVINNGELRRQKAVQILAYETVSLQVFKPVKISGTKEESSALKIKEEYMDNGIYEIE